ncbi:MAG: glycosyltransferase family 4 protein [Proteobacteria bacterium]|nr:glycosyltransferase family 4 protein [Pseudomonadota bacterium]
MPMHLALIISSLNSGGAQRVLSILANHWASQGHKISLITLDRPESPPFYPLNSKINIFQLNKNKPETSCINRLKAISDRFLSLRKKIQKLKPDLIVSFVDIMNITTLISSLGLKIPVIVSERTHPKYHKIPLLYQKLRGLFYSKASQVIVQTESAAQYFKNLKNVSVIPNAVLIPNKTKQDVNLMPQHIVSIGRLCPFKGFDTLIYTFSNLLQQYSNLILTIYGEGQERKNLEKLISFLNLENKVFLPGALKEIQTSLLKADLFIFPSHYEGFPNALCEAMAIGLPVIASNCSGNIDIIQDHINGRLFPIGDIEALTQISLELLKDTNQRVKLSQNAKQLSEQFHPNLIFNLWDQAISNSLKN